MALEDLLQDPSLINPNKGREPQPMLEDKLDSLSRQQLTILAGGKEYGSSILQGKEFERLGGWDFSRSFGAKGRDPSSLFPQLQSGGEKFWHMIQGSTFNYAAGLLENFNYDFSDISDLVQSNEKEYGSWVHDIAQKLRKHGQKQFPIYAGESLGDPGYWMNMGKEAAFSFGLLAGALSEQAVLSALTASTGGVAGTLQTASLIKKASLVPHLTFGAFKGIHEAYINSLETYDNTYQESIRRGASHEEAVKIASNAASIAYKTEVGPVTALNALQFGAIGRFSPFKRLSMDSGVSGGMTSMIDPILNKIPHKGLKEAARFGMFGASEAVEEGFQTAVSKYAEHKALGQENLLFEDFTLFDDHEMRDSMIIGGLVGMVMGGAGKVVTEASGKASVIRKATKQQLDFIDAMTNRVSQDISDLQEARANGDFLRENKLRYKMQKSNVFSALRLDFLTKNENAFESYVEGLKEIRDAVRGNDLETLKKYGINTEEDFKYIGENFDKYIQDAYELKENFLQSTTYTGEFNIAATITDAQQVMKGSQEFTADNNKAMEEIYAKSPLFQRLTPQGQAKYRLLVEQSALLAKSEKGKLSELQLERLEEVNKQLKEWDEANPKRSYSGHAKDHKTFGTLNQDKTIQENVLRHMDNFFLEDVADAAEKTFKHWTDPANVKAQKVKRAKEKVKKAKSKEEVQEAREEIQAEEGLTEETSEALGAAEYEQVISEITEEPTSEDMELMHAYDDVMDAIKESSDVPVLTDEEAMKFYEEAIQEDNKREKQPELPFSPLSENPLAKAVQRYVDKMGTEPTFLEFIQDMVQNGKETEVRDNFKKIASGWVMAGLPKEDFDSVYNKVFRPRSQEYKSIIDNIQGEEVTEAAETTAVVENDQLDQPVEMDYSNAKIVVDTPKLAYSSIDYIAIPILNQKTGEVIGMKYRDADTDLRKDNKVDSQVLLSPSQVNPGTRLTVKIPQDRDEHYINIWQDDYTKKGRVLFGEWVKTNNIEEGSAAWLDKVPMVVYRDENAKTGVAYLHDTDWYRPANVGFEGNKIKRDALIKSGKDNTRALRKKLYDSGKLTLEVTDKKLGSVQKTTDTGEAKQTLRDADPTATTGVVNSNRQLVTSKGIFNGVLLNAKPLMIGHTYSIRPGVVKDTYVAWPADPPQLSQEDAGTIYQAIQAFMSRKDPSPEIQKIRDDIWEISRYDIFAIGDFSRFMSHFIQSATLENVVGALPTAGVMEKPEHIAPKITRHFNTAYKILKGKKQTYPTGMPYFVFRGGNLYFGQVNSADAKGNQTYYVNSAKSPLLFKLRQVLSLAEGNTSFDGIQRDTPLPVWDGSNMVPGESHIDKVENSFLTNIKSFEITVDGNKERVTYVQPVIFIKDVEETQVEEAVDDIVQPEPETVETEEPVIEEEVELPTEVTSELATETAKYLNSLGIPSDHPLIKALKDRGVDPQKAFSPLSLTQVEVEELASIREKAGMNIPGFGITESAELVDYLYRRVSRNFDGTNKKISRKAAFNSVNKEFDRLLEESKAQAEALKKQWSAIPGSENMLDLISVIDQVEADLVRARESIEEDILLKLKKNWNVKEITTKKTTRWVTEDLDIIEKIHESSSLEESGKDKASYRMRRFLGSMPLMDKKGNLETGFLGVDRSIGYDKAYEVLETVLVSPHSVFSDYSTIIHRLEQYIPAQPWLEVLIKKLDNAPTHVKNEFLYIFAKDALLMDYVVYEKFGENTWKIGVAQTNQNEKSIVIKNSWFSNFKSSDPLVVPSEADASFYINKEEVQKLMETFESWKDYINVPNIEYQRWLRKFGITLSDETLTEMKNRPQYYGNQAISFENLFEDSSQTSGVFGGLYNSLKRVMGKEDTNFTDNIREDVNHPFFSVSSALSYLAGIEARFDLLSSSNSFRDAQSVFYARVQQKHGTSAVKKLKFDTDYRDAFKEKAFNRNSFMLDLLDDPLILEKFNVYHTGKTAVREAGQRPRKRSSMQHLSPLDQEFARLGYFTDQSSQWKKEIKPGLFLRFAKMLLPPAADKSQLLNVAMPVLDLKTVHFQGGIDNTVLDFAYSQIVQPEVDRIASFNLRGKENIEMYDDAAGMFLNLYQLNTLTYEGVRVIALMKRDPVTYDAAWFKNYMEPKAKEVLNQYFTAAAEQKFEEWRPDFIGVEKYFDEGQVERKRPVLRYIDTAYVNSKFKGSVEAKLKQLALDYVINTHITNSNLHMLILGDPAFYAKFKPSQYFQRGLTYLPKKEYGDKAYELVAKATFNNLSKRTAATLAPGFILAGAESNDPSFRTYKHVFLNDLKAISTNVLLLVEMFYPASELPRAKKLVEEYNKAKDKEPARKALESAYSRIAPFFNLEATDAQEYTTGLEHVRVMFKQGRITEEQFKKISQKIKTQRALEKAGRALTEKSKLSYAELELIFQPMKPVYTGFINDPESQVMRMMYIKSSSFPLLPQLTQTMELDGLRKLLEALEEESGVGVRASYQTANKVGGHKGAITPFLGDGTFNKELTLEDVQGAALNLDRANLKIQQDVPYKSASQEYDMIKQGTQMLKLIFGDGIIDIVGKEKYNTFVSDYREYTALKRELLFKKYGLDKTGQPIDPVKSLEVLQKHLREEATERGYTKQDVEALELSYIRDSAGNVIDLEFTIPLWFSPNSNKYESLLNSIVDKEILKMKISGASYVVGSEAGFQLKEDILGFEQSDIIFTSKFDGKLKAYQKGKNLTQVFLTPKWRDNEGNLIEFIDKKGVPNPDYVYRDKDTGRLMLKEDNIDSQLLNMSSFRIPTSSHVSMAQIEIAGILPREVGDLMIVPANLTAQKGLDFDVDKEYTYQLHTFIDTQGKINALNEETKEDYWKQKLSSGDVYVDIFTEQLAEASDTSLYDPSQDLEVDEETQADIDKVTLRIYENKLIQAYSDILSSDNPKIQEKINKPLSIEFASVQADLIEQAQSLTSGTFSILSSDAQKEKYFQGSASEAAIGAYSNHVIFHSLIQQVDEPIVLSVQESLSEDIAPLNITFGNLDLTGSFGKSEIIKPRGIQKALWDKHKRFITELLAEKQNAALDDANHNILGRVGINDETLNVDALLGILGADKDFITVGRNKVPVSVSYLLLSQPIIREYVKNLKNETKSKLKPYSPMGEKVAIFKTIKNYGGGEFMQTEFDYSTLTGQAMYDNLVQTENDIQQAALKLFLELKKYADQVSALQRSLSLQTSGIGKSFYSATIKRNVLRDLPNYNTGSIQILNAEKLVGDYTTDLSSVEDPDNYFDFGTTYIKPTTPVGISMVSAVDVAHKLWGKHFIYTHPAVELEYYRYKRALDKGEMSALREEELFYNFFAELKKYLFTHNGLGLYKTSPRIERSKLFIENPAKQQVSLANYLSNLGEDYDYLRQNKLINRFSYEVFRHGTRLSLIKFNNQELEGFDEEYLYIALIELMEMDKKLPDFNGRPYSTRMLAQDLIKYTFLEGAKQEAIQFSKYVPIGLLKSIPFAQVSRTWNQQGVLEDLFVQGHETSRFHRQLIQHSAADLPQVPMTEAINIEGTVNDFNSWKSFQLRPSETGLQFEKYKFLAIPNPQLHTGTVKFQVYEKVGDTYVRISALGAFGMSEYDMSSDNNYSLVNTHYAANEFVIDTVQEEKAYNNTFNMRTGTVTDVLGSIAAYDNKVLSTFAQAFLPHVSGSTKLEVGNMEKYPNAFGYYDTKSNTINVNDTALNLLDIETIGAKFLHEMTHVFLFDHLNEWVDRDGNLKKKNPPATITRLLQLYKTALKSVEGNEQVQKTLEDFRGGASLTPEQEGKYYGLTDIHEFIGMMVESPVFREEMRKVSAPKGVDIVQRFLNVVHEILKRVLGVFYTDSNITTETLKTLFAMLDEVKPAKKDKEVYDSLEADAKIEEILPPYAITEEELYLKDFFGDEFDLMKRRQQGPKLFSPVSYTLKAIDILSSERAEKMFAKGKKNGWSLDKILTELQVPKIQKEMILAKDTTDREDIIASLLADNSFAVEINTIKKEGNPTQYYSGLSVPGGTNYKENEIATPAIRPLITGHAQFSSHYGVGWFRSDEQKPLKLSTNYYQRYLDTFDIAGSYEDITADKKFLDWVNKQKELDLIATTNQPIVRRILEVQSDLFQQGRDKKNLITPPLHFVAQVDTVTETTYYDSGKWYEDAVEYEGTPEETVIFDRRHISLDDARANYRSIIKEQEAETEERTAQNFFLQLLNKKNNWVTFFIKSIIQDTIEQGYDKALFPKGDTAALIEGQDTIENFIEIKKSRINKLQVEQDALDYAKNRGEFGLDTSEYELKSNKIASEIEVLEEEIEAALAGNSAFDTIRNFYENTITNILKKQGYNPKEITDEHGNKWNEIRLYNKEELLRLPNCI